MSDSDNLEKFNLIIEISNSTISCDYDIEIMEGRFSHTVDGKQFYQLNLPPEKMILIKRAIVAALMPDRN